MLCQIPALALTTSRARLHRSTILSAFGPDHAFTVLFLGTHTRTSQWVTHHGIALAQSRLTSEFRWNPKPHDIVRFGPRPCPHSFVSGNSHENFPVGHPSWDCSCANSLNFEVPMEPEASELPKGLVLGRDRNIHIRLTGFTPLGDVGCHMLRMWGCKGIMGKYVVY
ncbi:unnamed protein product [Malus baccata var. baccata]